MHDVFILGLGYVGVPLAINASRAGFNVTAFDIDSNKVEKLRLGDCDSPDIQRDELINLQIEGSLKLVNQLPKAPPNSIFIITVPTPLNADRKPDLSYVEKACEFIANSINENCLVINESTSYIGTLRNFIKPKIDIISNISSIKYVVAPERIDPGNENWNLKNTPRVLGGITIESLEMAHNFYTKFCDEVISVSSPEVAEASKLLENSFRQVNIAFINEFSKISKEFNFLTSEVIRAASSKPFGFMPFFPSLGVGGHCIPVDPYYLSFSATQIGNSTHLLDIANQINFNQPKALAMEIEGMFQKNLGGKNIQIAGISYKIGISDLRESPAMYLIDELTKMGASVKWHDPIVKNFKSQVSSPLDPKIDLGVIVTPHKEIDFSPWRETNTNVIDLSTTSENFGWPKYF
jgi:UDP-N-acetyl-D-glucosamine dehydrogenase